MSSLPPVLRSAVRPCAAWRGLRADTRKTDDATAGARGAAVAVSAAGLGLAASYLAHQHNPAVRLEPAAPYSPPPSFGKPFAAARSTFSNEADSLVLAVKTLEPRNVRKVLQDRPCAAELTDTDGNTLFHLIASENARCDGKPGQAAEVMRLLLQDGWAVVDQKNNEGRRAEDIAVQHQPDGCAATLFKTRSRGFWEKTRAEDPLLLLRDTSPVPWAWTYPLQDEKRRSWAGLLKAAVSKDQCDRWKKECLEKTPWNKIPGVPRKTAWFVSEDCADCPYRYSGLEYPAVIFPPFMEEIRAEVCRLCGIPPEDAPNSCNVNVYDDQSQEVGWHSDDEVMFQGLSGDTRIVSFSLGVPRDFCYRLQGTKETLDCLSLGDGDIMTMEGLFQKHYKHAVPAAKDICGTRINFTFRWIVAKAHALDAGVKASA